MKAARYLVKAGDTLWSIAGTHYGDPGRWPDLYAYNNRPDVAAQGDRPIIDPERMVPGQIVVLPPHQVRTTQRRTSGGRSLDALRAIGSGSAPSLGGTAMAPGSSRGLPSPHSGVSRPGSGPPVAPGRNPAAETFVNDFAHVFRLDGMEIAVRGQAFSATLHLTGMVSLQRNGRVPLVSYSSRTADTQARLQSAMLLGHLLATQGTELGWDPRGNAVAYEAGLIRQAGIPSPSAALTEGVSERGRPVRTGTLVIPDFAGRIAGHAYVARDLRIRVDLTPGQTGAPPRPAAPRNERRDAGAGWEWAPALRRSDVLVVGAVLDESAVTPGNGLADSAATLAGAVAGRLGGASPTQFLNALPTPVRIGDGVRSSA